MDSNGVLVGNGILKVCIGMLREMESKNLLVGKGWLKVGSAKIA